MAAAEDEASRDGTDDAIRAQDPNTTPIEALRRAAHQVVTDDFSLVRFEEGRRRYIETVAASEALRARARAIFDKVARSLATMLAEAVGRPVGDPQSHVATSLQVATWGVAFI